MSDKCSLHLSIVERAKVYNSIVVQTDIKEKVKELMGLL